jgi:hypothetical protein
MPRHFPLQAGHAEVKREKSHALLREAHAFGFTAARRFIVIGRARFHGRDRLYLP